MDLFYTNFLKRTNIVDEEGRPVNLGRLAM